MRALIITLFIALPFALVGCAESPQEEAYEEPAPPADLEGDFGDGDIIEEPAEPEVNMFMGADTDGDGMLHADEFTAAWPDADMTLYDTDADGMVSVEEFDAYMMQHPGM